MLNEQFRPLFKEINIGKIKIKNRIAMAPMGMIGLINGEGVLSQRAIDYFIERAKGDVGLIITGLLKVENEIDKMLVEPVISPAAAAPLSELAEGVHIFDSKVFVQLSAGFGSVNADIIDDPNIIPVSASVIPAYWEPKITTRALTIREIQEIIKSFGRAAKILKSAGVDGIELHGHEGYLFDQFTTALWNKRNDKYGGDLEGRLTFSVEVLNAIKENAGEDFPVIYRFGLKHYIKKPWSGALKGEKFKEVGRDIEEGIKVIQILEEAGFDGLHVDAGAYDSWYWAHPPMYQPHGCMVDMAEQAKKVVKRIPVIAVGRLGLPELAVKVIVEGKADIVALGRALLADPYWPKKVREGKLRDIRPCIACHEGCMKRIMMKKTLSCAVNPQVGKEKLYKLDFVQNKKKVLVIGGGVSGMEVARISAIRGHNVTLYEKNNSLGGHLIEAGVPDFKKDIFRLLDWYKSQLSKLNIRIELGIEVTPKLVKVEKPDVVVVATGSTSIIPKIANINDPKVITAIDLFLGKKEVGKNVVIVGGGLVGCETGLWLAENGKKVTIVEMLPEIAQGDFPANRTMLIDLLIKNKVEIITNSSICKITDEGVAIINKNFIIKIISCNTVVLALGLKPEDKIYSLLSREFSEIYKIGDCKEPHRILDAIWDGYYLGFSL
jgi:2-enoate reductase